MDKLFQDVKQFLQWQTIKTSGLIFRAHCSFTTAALITCSLLVTATEFVGSPIQCITDHTPVHVINTYCWIQGTFTIPTANKGIGSKIPHHGIANDYGEKTKYHNYYQWVCFVVFGQALLCYAPKLIWDHCEGGLLRSILQDLNEVFMDSEEREKKKKKISDYLVQYMTMHRRYAFQYLFCEFLCLVNMTLQLYFMNWFLNGEFISYGWKVLVLSQQDQADRDDPMIYVFPRMTKCVFSKYGPSGSIQNYDSLCILPLNVINEKTYIFIWFWFIVLLDLLFFVVLIRICLLCSTYFRTYLLYSHSNAVPKEVCRIISEKADFGDWWILYLIRNNIGQLCFRDIAFKVAKDINERQKHKNRADDNYILEFEMKETRLYPSLN